MPKNKDKYRMTNEDKMNFKRWLFENNMSLCQFARSVGCSRQYLTRALNGEIYLTDAICEKFRKGGYEFVKGETPCLKK